MVQPSVSHSRPTSHDMSVAKLKREELSQAGRAALDDVVWRKIDRWVIPLCTTFLLLAVVVCF